MIRLNDWLRLEGGGGSMIVRLVEFVQGEGAHPLIFPVNGCRRDQ
jgi:hypothetical protein